MKRAVSLCVFSLASLSESQEECEHTRRDGTRDTALHENRARARRRPFGEIRADKA
ncbi:hypothetical protein F2P79_022503 [Pimephales promelas]|nr:hypothetical protein F2P79_022501 [Pimephales promelas]KAG1930168.1 hypothetical protein F2P79_022503 [Pimephales promelas]